MLEFDGHLFASLLLATAGLDAKDGENVDDSVFGDPNGLAGVLITAPRAKTKVKVSARAGQFWEGGAFECVLPLAEEKYWVAPRIRFRYGALRAVNAPTSCEALLSLEVDGVPLGEKAVSGRVHPLKECVYGTTVSAGFTDKTGVPMNAGFGWLFTAYVDEAHPFAAKLVKEALDTGIVRAFDGYASEDPEQVLLQVYALWEALSRRGARYQHYLQSTSISKFVLSEPMRTMDEMAANPSGTSAEAVALLSSALLRIGLRPYFVIVGEQIALGVDRSDGRGDFVGIDPTFVGKTGPLGSRWPLALRDSLPETVKDAPSLAAFSAALSEWTINVRSYRRQFEDIDPRWQMIGVRQARADGIRPFGRSLR